MRMSENGLRCLKELEGSRSKPYSDVAGHLTTGVGHLLTAPEIDTGCLCLEGTPINYRNGLSQDQINILLQQDLDRFEDTINDLHIEFIQHQFDSLCSFVFNIGITAFKNSTLYRRLNEGRFNDVPMEMRRWNKAGGAVVKGLINRREKEIDLWLGDV